MQNSTNEHHSLVLDVKNALQKTINTLPAEDRDLNIVAMIEGIASYLASEAVSYANNKNGDLLEAEYHIGECFNVMNTCIAREFEKYYRGL
ncbi:MAG: hypothetical protein COB37_10410 [Kordiimonadales bacterium]|nr:MAG: hypothetical protein COB37_10410 [Kordiimonadales bacterium]